MSVTPTYRLAADYDCHAVWLRRADGGLDNLAPDELGLSAALAGALQRWADIYNGTLDRSDPMSSGFATDLEHEIFSRWGRSLATWLAAALGEPVEYFDDASQVHVIVD